MRHAVELADKERARRQAEASLRESERQMRLVLRATNDAVWVWDLASDRVTWSDAIETVFGYALGEVVLGTTWWFDRIHPDDRDRVVSGLTKLVETGGQTWQAEYRFRCANGAYATVINRASVAVDEAGKSSRMIGAMIDITERTRLEQELRQSQKMEAIGRVAGGIAHDFNNLLTVITGYSGLLLSNLRPEDPTRKDLEEIRDAGQRAAKLVSQLLAFSRRQVLAPKVVDLNAILSDVEKLLRRVLYEDV